MARGQCPNCGTPAGKGAAFCTNCGADLATARRHAAPEPDEEWEPRGALILVYGFLNLFPGLVRPVVLVMFLLSLPVAVAIGWLGFAITAFGAMISGFMIAGFGMLVYWAGLTWLIYGYVCLPSEALAEFDARQWAVMLLLGLAPVGLGLYWLGTQG